MATYYDVLGVDRKARRRTIQEAYDARIERFDKATDLQSQGQCKQIEQAGDILLNSWKKRIYDRWLKSDTNESFKSYRFKENIKDGFKTAMGASAIVASGIALSFNSCSNEDAEKIGPEDNIDVYTPINENDETPLDFGSAPER